MKKVNTISVHAASKTGAAAAIAIAAIFALFFAACSTARAQNVGSPAFVNPSEIKDRPAEKRLLAILELNAGTYTIPNAGQETLRQFRGWNPAFPRPGLLQGLAPGPTLRTRLGDLVEIYFQNRIDDSKFPYTFVTDRKEGTSDFGCDLSGTALPPDYKPPAGYSPPIYYPYPGLDTFPNCFHGSSTANIHFHGTHTSPDGLSDNVLVQILPQVKQPDWTNTFNGIFNSRRIPPKWENMPVNYRDAQVGKRDQPESGMIGEYDTQAAKQAAKNGLPPPESLWKADWRMINDGQWPQYLMGAFPNFFEIPDKPIDEDKEKGRFKAGQAPGTHWYHAHKHGSTSQDILNGLAGALIIESTQECPQGELPKDKPAKCGYDQFIRKYYKWGNSYGAHEKIFVFQEFDSTHNLERSRSQTGGKRTRGPESQRVLVNGKLTPTLTMLPGEVQLWRFIDATEGNAEGVISGLFQAQGFSFRQTAFDGVQFSPTNFTNQPFLNNQVPGGLTLAAGNRADVLVQAPTTFGVTKFTNASSGDTLFFVEVVKCLLGSSCTNTPNPPFPPTWAEMPRFLYDLPKPVYDDKKNPANPNTPVKFQWEKGRTGVGLKPATGPSYPPHFMINDQQFEENGPKVDQCMKLNGLQDWVLENHTTVAHPFHIHINPFQIVKIETPSLVDKTKPASDTNVKYSTYEPKDNFIWSDVIAIPVAAFSNDGSEAPGKVTIRQMYLDFTGTYVLHCHILAHEDRGMMQLVRVVPDDDYPKGCQEGIPEHH